jgi:hypothetical protein
MQPSSAIIEETIDVLPDQATLTEETSTDRHQELLDAANAAIDRFLSDDPVEFLNRCKQAGGE